MEYTVNNRSSGRTFTVKANETVLDAAIRQGIVLAYGCRNGVCGTCRGRLVEGQVNYASGQPDALDNENLGEDAVILCQAQPLSNLVIEAQEIDAAQDIPVRHLPCRVARHDMLANDVMRIYLKQPDNQRLQFLAGQYINILLEDGRQRAFSLANAPHDDEYLELHVRRVDDGEYTGYLFSELEDKAIMRIEGPLGTFFLREHSTRSIILMAGGTGFAPIKSIIEHALSENIQRPMHFYWGVRAEQDLYLKDLPEQWAREHENFHYTPVLSEPGADWTGRSGYVHQAIADDFDDLSGYEVYTAGPPVMVEAGARTFAKLGLPLEYYFSDSFEYSKD
jgi:CDP-4-dehydro-6-deoxyglucose reductase